MVRWDRSGVRSEKTLRGRERERKGEREREEGGNKDNGKVG